MSAGPKRRSGFLALIGKQFGVSEPGVSIERGVQKVVAVQGVAVLARPARAAVGLGVAVADAAAQHPPTTAGRDLAELLGVDVHHVPTPSRLHVLSGVLLTKLGQTLMKVAKRRRRRSLAG
jgi:hypothetical protein